MFFLNAIASCASAFCQYLYLQFYAHRKTLLFTMLLPLVFFVPAVMLSIFCNYDWRILYSCNALAFLLTVFSDYSRSIKFVITFYRNIAYCLSFFLWLVPEGALEFMQAEIQLPYYFACIFSIPMIFFAWHDYRYTSVTEEKYIIIDEELMYENCRRELINIIGPINYDPFYKMEHYEKDFGLMRQVVKESESHYIYLDITRNEKK